VSLSIAGNTWPDNKIGDNGRSGVRIAGLALAPTPPYSALVTDRDYLFDISALTLLMDNLSTTNPKCKNDRNLPGDTT